MTQMNLFTKQKQTPRHRKQTYGYQGGKELGRDKLGDWNWHIHTAAAAKSLQSCLTLCDPMDGSPPESPVPGILQARTLEWVAISFSNAWKRKLKVMPPWTAAHQAPPSMGFSRQEYWSRVSLPSQHWENCNKLERILGAAFQLLLWGAPGLIGMEGFLQPPTCALWDISHFFQFLR